MADDKSSKARIPPTELEDEQYSPRNQILPPELDEEYDAVSQTPPPESAEDQLPAYDLHDASQRMMAGTADATGSHRVAEVLHGADFRQTMVGSHSISTPKSHRSLPSSLTFLRREIRSSLRRFILLRLPGTYP